MVILLPLREDGNKRLFLGVYTHIFRSCIYILLERRKPHFILHMVSTITLFLFGTAGFILEILYTIEKFVSGRVFITNKAHDTLY